MALPFQKSSSGKRNHLIAIDLGSRTTKAVHLHRKNGGFSLVSYVLQDAPVFDRSFSADVLGEHLKKVGQSLNARSKQVTLAPGVTDSLLRLAELPMIPVMDMRMMLKFNTKTYLQQDLPDHVFDCCVVPPRSGASQTESGRKARVLVGGAKKQLVDDLQVAAKQAGFVAEQIFPGLAGAPNAFEMAEPEVFQNEVVALVDVGFKNSTITVLQKGDLSLMRVVAIGGDKLTSGLAEALGISYAEAEGLKVGLAEEVQSVLQALLIPLGRELRASIDFFEHQHDVTVSQVFVSGGSARSQFIVEMLQTELMVPCKGWNPLGFVHLELPPQQMAEIEQVAPQLAVATGAALAFV